MKSLHSLLLFLLAGLCPIFFPTMADEITVYSHRHYPSDDVLFEKFTEQTGIRVRVVKAGADELIERLRAEGDNTRADVLITADAGRLHIAKTAGLLLPLESEILTESIPEPYRDPDNTWFGFTLRARVMIYAKDRVQAGELTTYEDLANRKWRGRLLARSSSHIYNQSLLASMIAAHGEAEALAWARAVRGNLARAPQGSDRDQMRAVARGLADVAIVNTYYLGLMHNSPDPQDRELAGRLAVHFPNQEDRGIHVNVSGGGVIKASRRPEQAQKFLEFLVSEEAQKTFPLTTSEFPVVEGIELSDLQKSWGAFKADTLNLGKLGDLNVTAVRLFNMSGWE
ncbi:MAG: Fe(3+) ABC transporter substrate-binding protein [Verrucomicrobia bacterium]|nr:Fe(3+) ABC transporter substrate-binding protein [Verrucomicrobiota bacterium]MCH8512148.1 Fe(3+) ABC transporter substrate-binding protein [Kiritimatiellia bacterium]